jgi:hypothetical protein
MSFAEIKPIRLLIDDPSGINEILEVSNYAALPASPAPQTAYRTIDAGIYYQTDVLATATPGDYQIIELLISDAILQSLYDRLGQESAICRAFGLLARKLGNQSRIVRNETGAESTEYAKISELYRYYRDLAADCAAQKRSDDGTNTGRYGTMIQPTIAGGNL